MNTNNKSEEKLNYLKVAVYIDGKLINDNDELGGIDIIEELLKFKEDTNANEIVFRKTI